MKIVDIAEFYSERGGGVRTYVNDKLEEGARQGLDIVVVAPGGENRVEARKGGRVIWVKSPPIPIDRRYRYFNDDSAVHAILDRERPDVVEASSPWRAAKLVAHWPGHAVKTFVMHQEPVATYPQFFLRGVLSDERVDWLFQWYWRHLGALSLQFDAIIAASTWLAERLDSRLPKKAHFVSFGIDKAGFSPRLRSETIRREMLAQCGIRSADALLLVSSCRHNPEKRVGLLIDAVDKLARIREIGLYVMGDGLLRPWVNWHAKRRRNIYVSGYVSDRARVAQLLASADIFLHGCESETFGISVAEAICSGLPLVVPNEGGAAALVDRDYAETYRPADVNSCSEAILRLAARDRMSLVRASQGAASTRIRSRAEHFSELFSLYRDLCQAHKRNRAVHTGEIMTEVAPMPALSTSGL